VREYSNRIALLRNGRGVWSLDSSVGCSSGTTGNPKGCYSECYAAKSAKYYGYDFKKTVFRDFENEAHVKSIVREIFRINMPFIRIGTSGDPSENWQHTIGIIKQLGLINKDIVIITKHWQSLTDSQLRELTPYKICVNTSVSALDEPRLLANCLSEYRRIKPYCKSLLRVVSCDFNRSNETGKKLAAIQDELLGEHNAIDTVFRVSRGNELVKQGVINVRKMKFLGKDALVSKYNRKTYFGKCSTCSEMCGAAISA
jgi:hypothetical protein